MSENKTREEILENSIQRTQVGTPPGISVVTPEDALTCMEYFADQEKRSTAIAFADWLHAKYEWDAVYISGELISDWKDKDGNYTTTELYDLFIINSL